VRREYVGVTEVRIAQTCDRTAVVQDLPNFVTAFSHYIELRLRDGSELTLMVVEPGVDGGIVVGGVVEA